MLPRSFLWSALKRACEWMILWLNTPVESAVHQLSEGLVTCVIPYLDTGCVFAAAATQQISFFFSFFAKHNFEEVVLCELKKSKFCHYVVHIVLAFPAWRKGGHFWTLWETGCLSEGGAGALGQSGTCWEDENAPGVGFWCASVFVCGIVHHRVHIWHWIEKPFKSSGYLIWFSQHREVFVQPCIFRCQDQDLWSPLSSLCHMCVHTIFHL